MLLVVVVVALAGLLDLAQEHVLDLGRELAQVAHEALVRVLQSLRVRVLHRVWQCVIVSVCRVRSRLQLGVQGARGILSRRSTILPLDSIQYWRWLIHEIQLTSLKRRQCCSSISVFPEISLIQHFHGIGARKKWWREICMILICHVRVARCTTCLLESL